MEVFRRQPALAWWLVAHIVLVFFETTSGAGGVCEVGFINVTGSDGNVTTFCRCSANANPAYYTVGGSLSSECACDSGYYSSSALAWNVTCQLCPAGSYCSGDQSITGCPTGSTSPSSSASVSSCFCQPGYSGAGGSFGCEACGIGTFKPENGTAACRECPVATYNDATAASSEASCTACPLNSNSSAGSGALTDCKCDFGYTGPAGGPCSPCPVGTYHAYEGATFCAECATASYSTAVAATSFTTCLACPEFHNSPAGSSAETDCVCLLGYQTNGTDKCVPCPLDTYKASDGDQDCTQCPDGSLTTTTGGDSLESCVCRPGFYGLLGGPCTVCPPGFFCTNGVLQACPAFANSPNASDAITDCQCNAGYQGQDGEPCSQCRAGSYCLGSVNVITCPEYPVQESALQSDRLGNCTCVAGYFGPDGGTCTICPVGSYCSGREAIESCPSFTSSPEGSSSILACTCIDGYYGDPGSACTECEQGNYCVNGVKRACRKLSTTASTGAYLESQCLCNDGYYPFEPKAGFVVCNPCQSRYYCADDSRFDCPANSWSPVQSSTVSACSCDEGYTGPNGGACIACVAGKYKDSIGTATCTDCLSGYYLDGTGATTAETCVVCPSNTDSSAGSGPVTQCVCNAGYTGPDGGTCSACAAGKFKATAGSQACSDCVAGEYSLANTGATSCQPCPVDTTSGAGSGTCSCNAGFTGSDFGPCSLCAAGTYKTSPGSDACASCGVNTYSTTLGASSDATCLSCPAFTVSPAGSTEQTDCVCDLGYTGADGGACAECERDTYKDVTGSSACTSCPFAAGSLRHSTDLSDCICNAGYSLESVNCVACVQGKYKPNNGSQACTTSAGGYYVDVEAATAETVCPANSNSVAGRTAVSDCMCNAGYTGSDGGPCSPCAAGTYKPSSGSYGCTLCVAGTYSSSVAAIIHTVCTNCPLDTFSNSGSQSAADCTCDPGFTYSSPTCASCSAGTYKESQGNDGCTQCPTNASTVYTESTTILQCICTSGYYGDLGGTCSLCTSNYWCNQAVQNSCPYFSTSPRGSAVIGDCACGAGRISNVNPCDRCPLDHYCENGVKHQCPTDTYSAHGSTALSDCICWPWLSGPPGGPCTSGGGGGGSWICPLNSFPEPESSSDINDCVCRAGYYGTNGGTCTPCPAGSYCIGGNNIQSCSTSANCPEQAGFADECLCNAGFYGVPGGSCTLCPAGSWCSKSLLNSCPANAISAAGSSLQTDCYCPDGYVGANGEACVACVAGTYCRDGNLSDCQEFSTSPDLSHLRENCTCNAGYTSSDGITCTPCAAGSYKLISGSSACVLSEANHYSWLEAAADRRSVTPCPLYQLSPEGSVDVSQCICKQGYTGPDGYVFGCTPCEAGTYKDRNGSLACTLCPESTYLEGSASTTLVDCLGCPNNTQSPEGSNLKTDCTCNAGYSGPDGFDCPACDAGTYKAVVGAASCINCVAGKYSIAAAATASSVCSSCPSNSVSAAGSNEYLDCVCDVGYTGANATVCRQCDAGTYKDTTGSAVCSLCPADSTSLVGASTLNDCKCNAGFEGSASSGCSPCPAGEYKDTWASVSCSLCPVGTYRVATGGKNVSECTSCPVASSSDSGSTASTDCFCIAGATGPGGGPCTSCSAGSYKSTTGSGACSLCPSGKYLAAVGAVSSAECTKCPSNSFADNQGSPSASNCTCNDGYTPDAGLTTCIPCQQGYKGWRGNESCAACPTGSETIETGRTASSECYCSAGYYGDTGGPCTLCSAGYYCGGGEQLVCPRFASSTQGSPLKTNCSCEPGYEGSDGGLCGRCSTDFYCPGGENEIQCPLFPIQGSVEKSTSLYNCTCEIGFEGPAGINCSLCSGGYYCPGAGQVDQCPSNSRSLLGGGNLKACFCQDGYDGPIGSACDLCPRGKWCNGGTTRDCPENTNSALGSSILTDCICEPGYRGPPGSACIGCSKGKYCFEGTQYTCTANSLSPAISGWAENCTCNAGYTGPDGGLCAQCAAGKYKSAPGSQTCDLCPAGKYSDRTALTDGDLCKVCPANSHSESGSSALTYCLCNQGYTGPNGGPCTACAAATYKQSSGSAACASCPLNGNSPVASINLTACTCNEGYSGPNGGTCGACDAGTYKAVTGTAVCSNCIAGTYSTATAARSASTCTSCSAGKYSEFAGANKAADCLTCPFQTTHSIIGSDNVTDCTCNVGYTGPDGKACSACALGTYKAVRGSAPCASCDAGTYQDVVAATRCFSCVADTYSTTVGAQNSSFCQPCPGNSSSATRSNEVTDCKCNVGFSAPDGQECPACVPGKFKDTIGSDPCTDCSAGAYQPRYFQTNCELCAAGKYSETVGAPLELTCITCPNNTASLNEGSGLLALCICVVGHTGPDGFECVGCAPGTYKPTTGSAVCTACVAGKFNPNASSVSESACQRCDAGTYSTTVGAFTIDVCEVCPRQSNSPSGSNELTDCTCNFGFEGPDGGSCEPCPIGSFKDYQGSAPCDLCPVHTYTDRNATITCASCPFASSSDVGSVNITNCTCNAGYAGPPGTDCSACERGKFKKGLGDNCELCQNGTYTDEIGMTVCLDCTPNSNSPPGSSVHTNCTCNFGYYLRNQEYLCVTPEFDAVSNMAPFSQAGGREVTVIGYRMGVIDYTVAASIGNTACQSSVWMSDTSITCKGPIGLEGSLTVSVSVANARITSSETGSYDLPSLSTSVLHNSAEGTLNQLSLRGANFGAYNPTVRARQQSTSAQATEWRSDSSLAIKVSAGKGASMGFAVTSGIQVGSLSHAFSFDQPSVSALDPRNFASGAARSLEVSGDTFGITVASLASRIEGTACEVTEWTSESSLSCVATAIAPSERDGLQVVVTAGVRAASLSLAATYDGPVASGVLHTNQPVLGGSTVTVQGGGMGTIRTSAAVGVGGTACELTSWQSDSTVLVRLGSGTGGSKSVVVTAGMVSGSVTEGLSISEPRVSGGAVVNLAGGATFSTVSGSGFGSRDMSGKSRVGGTESQESVWGSETSMFCRAEAGAGSSLMVVVTVGQGAGSGSVFFSYSSPTSSSLVTANWMADSPELITIHGSGLGAEALSLDLRSGSTAAELTHWISETAAMCQISRGSGKSFRVAMTVGQQSGTITQSSSFDLPIASSVELVNMPTNAAAVLVFGSNLAHQDSSLKGKFGHTVAEVSKWTSSSSILCQVASRKSNSMAVVVTGGILTATVTEIASFDMPTVTSMAEHNTPNAHTEMVTLNGAGLGTIRASASGRAGATSFEASEWISESSLACRMATGSGATSTVVVTGGMASSSVTEALSMDSPAVSGGGNRTLSASGGSGVTVAGSGLGLESVSGSMRIGGSEGEASRWVSDSSLVCQAASGIGASKRIVLTVALLVGSATEAVSYGGGTVSSVEGANMPTPGGGVMTVTGDSMSLSMQSIWARVGGTSVESTVWASVSSLHCRTSRSFGSTHRVTMSIGALVGSITAALSLDIAQVPSLNAQNVVSNHFSSVEVTGSGLSRSFTARGSVGSTGCENTEWVSISSVTCAFTPTYGRSLALVLTAGSGPASVSEMVSFDSIPVPFVASVNSVTAGSWLLIPALEGIVHMTMSVASRVGGTSCEGTAWTSTSSMSCRVSAGVLAPSSLKLTSAGVVSSSQDILSYDAPVQTKTSVRNMARRSSDILTLNGVAFGTQDYTLRARAGGTVCNSNFWTSDSSVSCKIPALKEWNIPTALVVTVATQIHSTTQTFSYDVPICPGNSWYKRQGIALDWCTCLPGHTGDGLLKCDPCGLRTFKVDDGNYNCTECPIDTYGVTLNSTSNSSCLPCAEHSMSHESRNQCVCKGGYYGPMQPSSVPCVICPEGTWCTGGISDVCPDSKKSTPPGSDSPEDCVCDRGFFKNTAGECELCLKVTYSDEIGNGACSECPPNAETISTGAKSITECICASGYVLSQAADGSTFFCDDCPAGKWCLNGVEYSCPQHSETTVISGGISIGSAGCICLPGYYGSAGSVCHECPMDSYCPGGNNIIPCQQNAISPAGSSSSSSCTCKSGYKAASGGECVMCAADEGCGIVDECGANAQLQGATCECRPGYYGDAGVDCNIAPEGTYAPGGNTVQACPTDASSPAGSRSIAACTCNAGYIGYGGVPCVPCPADSWCYGGIENPCPISAHSNPGAGSLSECLCPLGYQRSPDGACVLCPVNTWCRDGVLTVCPAFMISPAGSTNSSNCTGINPAPGEPTAPAVEECPTSPCGIGYYRSECAAPFNGKCANCTNGPPENFKYVSSGIPYYLDNCAWRCVDGFEFSEGPLCVEIVPEPTTSTSTTPPPTTTQPTTPASTTPETTPLPVDNRVQVGDKLDQTSTPLPETTPIPPPPAAGPSIAVIAAGTVGGAVAVGGGLLIYAQLQAIAGGAKVAAAAGEAAVVLPLGQPVNAPLPDPSALQGVEAQFSADPGQTAVKQAWGDPASMQIGESGQVAQVEQTAVQWQDNPAQYRTDPVEMLPQEEALELQAFDDMEV